MNQFLPWLGPLYLLAVALPLARIDIRSHRLPNRLTLPLIPISLASQLATAILDNQWAKLGTSLGCASLVAVIGISINRFGVLGMGDVKLITGMTLCLAWFNPVSPLIALALSFAAATVVVLALLATRKTRMGSSIALGPYLLFGFVTTLAMSF